MTHHKKREEGGGSIAFGFDTLRRRRDSPNEKKILYSLVSCQFEKKAGLILTSRELSVYGDDEYIYTLVPKQFLWRNNSNGPDATYFFISKLWGILSDRRSGHRRKEQGPLGFEESAASNRQ